MEIGTLYGVSVGTGDPELITVKGLRILQTSPVVAFPSGVNSSSGIAQNIINPWLQPHQHTLALEFPYVRDEQVLATAWEQAAQQVVYYLQQGMDVAFACLGDISFYSTFTYLAQVLRQRYPKISIKTIPGVCSPMAIAAELGIPLTVNQQKMTVLPALYSIEELETALDLAEIVVLLKVSSVYEQVWQILEQRNLLTKSAIVEKATFTEQKIYRNLQQYPKLNLSYFSVLLISQEQRIFADPLSTVEM